MREDVQINVTDTFAPDLANDFAEEARTVWEKSIRATLLEILSDSRFSIDDDGEGSEPYIEFVFGQTDDVGHARLAFAALIDEWIELRLSGDQKIHPEEAAPFMQALEAALARIKPLIRR